MVTPPPPPPPYDRPRNCISSLCRKGVEDQHSKIPRVSKKPKIQKFQPKFRVLGNSSGSLKIQNSCSRLSFQKSKPWGGFFGFWDCRKLERELDSWILRLPLEFPKIQALGWVFWNPKFLEFPKIQNPKIPTQVSDFLETRAGASKSKNPKFLEFPKIQKPKNSNPSFGFLETRAGASKSKIRAPARVVKNPKIPSQVSDFWKLEREPQNPKFVLPLEFPKIQTLGWIFGLLDFGNSRNFGFLDFEAPARVSKNPKLGLEFLDVGIFGNSRNFGFLDFEAPARVSSNPNLGVGFLDFWNFGNSSGSPIFGFEAPAGVSKIPTLGLGFLGFLNFVNWSLGKIF